MSSACLLVSASTRSYKAPWLVALSFGLLHGFGFAGALSEIGLPQTDIPLALLFFNVGVEVGQLMFVAAVIVVQWAIQKIRVLAYLGGTGAGIWNRFPGCLLVYPADGFVLVKGKERNGVVE